jgi:hypothetical protein
MTERIQGIGSAAHAIAGATTDLLEPLVTRRDTLRHAASALADATTASDRGSRLRGGTLANGIQETAWIGATAFAVTGSATSDLDEPLVTRRDTLTHAASTLADATTFTDRRLGRGVTMTNGNQGAGWIRAPACAVAGATTDLDEPLVTRRDTLRHAASTLAGATTASDRQGGTLANGLQETAWIGATAQAVAGATTDLPEPLVTRRDTLRHAASTLAGASTGSDRRRGRRGLTVANGIRNTEWVDAAAFAVAVATTDLPEPRVTRRDTLTHAASTFSVATTGGRRVGWRRCQ